MEMFICVLKQFSRLVTTFKSAEWVNFILLCLTSQQIEGYWSVPCKSPSLTDQMWRNNSEMQLAVVRFWAMSRVTFPVYLVFISRKSTEKDLQSNTFTESVDNDNCKSKFSRLNIFVRDCVHMAWILVDFLVLLVRSIVVSCPQRSGTS